MQVETYEVELQDQSEIAALASEGEHAMLIEKLGLTGQQKLIGGADIKPFPYRIMTMEEQRVFKVLFPQETKLENYSSELIPIRVLQVATHALDTGFLDKGLWVWHPKDSMVDPILVGQASIPGQQWGTRLYLLARWGSALLPFPRLVEQAKTRWKARRKAGIQLAQQELAGHLATLEAAAEKFFVGDHVTENISF